MTRKTIISSMLSAALSLFMLQASSSGIYKWVDDSGQVHYGEEPGSIDAEKVPIRQNETTTRRPINEADVEILTKDKNKDKDSENNAGKPEEPAMSKKEKQQLCKEGKNDYATISSRGRLREVNKKGEYVYLTEEQRQQRLAAAKEKQRKYCH